MAINLTFFLATASTYSNKKLYYSSDKKNFTQITTIPFSDISDYCYNSVTKEIWCVYNSDSISYAYVSTDLNNWSMKTLPFASVAGIIYAEGRGELIVFQNRTSSSGSSQIAVSTDNGTTWTSKTTLSGSSYYGPFMGLRYLPDEDTYVKNQPDNVSQWYYSDDLMTWTLVTASYPTSGRYLNGYDSINFEQYDNGYYCGGYYLVASNTYNPILFKIASMKTGIVSRIWSSSIQSSDVRTWNKPMKYNNFIIWFWPYYPNNYTITAVVYDLNTDTANTGHTVFIEPFNRTTGCVINGINGATIFFTITLSSVVSEFHISDFALTNVNNFQITNETIKNGIGSRSFDLLKFDLPISIGKSILKFNGQKVIKINNQRVATFNNEFIFPPKEQ